VTSPYREAAGLACVRCGRTMIGDDDRDAICPDGCGTWIEASALDELVGSHDLRPFERPIAHWKATPWVQGKCPRCIRGLTALYMPLPSSAVLTHGLCEAHGTWLDRAGRAELTAAYAEAIAAYNHGAAAKAAARALRTDVSEATASRIETLEHRVVALQDVVRQLQQDMEFLTLQMSWKK